MLTDREILILKLLEKGMTHEQIGSQLGLSVSRVGHLSADAKRKQRLPPQSYGRLLSNRTARLLHSICGPDEVAPTQIRSWLLDGTLRLYGHSWVTFKGIKTRNAGRGAFLELCDYAGVEAGELPRLRRTKTSPPSERMINMAIAILERAGFKLTPPEGAGEIDHQPQSADRRKEHNTRTARTRITDITKKTPEGRIQYLVYVSKEEESDAKPSPRRYSTMDEAARACISLSEHGYKILGVSLPGGNYVTGPQIERAITMGISSVKIALTS